MLPPPTRTTVPKMEAVRLRRVPERGGHGRRTFGPKHGRKRPLRERYRVGFFLNSGVFGSKAGRHTRCPQNRRAAHLQAHAPHAQNSTLVVCFMATGTTVDGPVRIHVIWIENPRIQERTRLRTSNLRFFCICRVSRLPPAVLSVLILPDHDPPPPRQSAPASPSLRHRAMLQMWFLKGGGIRGRCADGQGTAAQTA